MTDLISSVLSREQSVSIRAGTFELNGRPRAGLADGCSVALLAGLGVEVGDGVAAPAGPSSLDGRRTTASPTARIATMAAIPTSRRPVVEPKIRRIGSPDGGRLPSIRAAAT